MRFTLNRREWREFKTENGLTKSKVFQKADVGPSLVRLQKAWRIWDRDQGKKAMENLVLAASDVQKAFRKFMKIKGELGELSKTAESQIKSWNEQIEENVNWMRRVNKKSPDKLKQKDVDYLYGIFDGSGY